MKRFGMLAAVVAVIGLAGALRADDKAGLTGTWKWTVERNGNNRDFTIKLKLDGDKLTGSMPGRNNQETAIENGTFKDGQFSFTITRERNGQKNTTKYSGKLAGDAIEGKIEPEGGNARDWKATRVKESK